MALTITHAHVATGTDAGNGEVHKAEWNAAHTVSGTLSADDVVDGTTNKAFTATEKTKLAGIETGADVTDATNVDAAGAVMNSDTSTAAMSFVIDEDSMASNLDTKVPTQQSVKTYVDAADSAWYAAAIARANHTGTQTASTISDFNSSVDARISSAMYGKQAIFIPASSMIARTTNGATSFSTELTTNDVMLRGYEFSTSTAQAVQFFTALPKQWNEGTVSFRAYWSGTSGSGGVAWSLRGRVASDDDAMDGSWGTAQTVTDTYIAANDLHVTGESSAITIGGTPAEGDLIFFEVTREVANASDTLGTNARLLGIELYITTNAGTDA